jgi:hypothetical protein
MSDLQWSLLAIGALVVGAVYCYNWMQEWRLHRRMQQAFGAAHDDVLLRGGVESALHDGRLEPQLTPQEPDAEPARGAGDASPAESLPTGFDAVLDFVVRIDAESPVPDSAIDELTGQLAAIGKPVHLAGLDDLGGNWEDVVRGRGGGYTALSVSLQLVNRAGPVNAAQLAAFCDAVRSCAERMPATVTFPDVQEALQMARDLDGFCSGVDVAVGVNVIAGGGSTFPGAKIRSTAEAVGFKLDSDGVFHFRNDQRQTLFTLDNHEPAPFLPESVKGLSTRGVTLLLDVPRVAHGAEAFDRMVGVARQLAQTLDGTLVDDNRAPLSEAGIARIKDQVRSIHAVMDSRGIPAGGARALRLFS